MLNQKEITFHVFCSAEHSCTAQQNLENRADLVPCDIGGARLYIALSLTRAIPVAVAAGLWLLPKSFWPRTGIGWLGQKPPDHQRRWGDSGQHRTINRHMINNQRAVGKCDLKPQTSPRLLCLTERVMLQTNDASLWRVSWPNQALFQLPILSISQPSRPSLRRVS